MGDDDTYCPKQYTTIFQGQGRLRQRYNRDYTFVSTVYSVGDKGKAY